MQKTTTFWLTALAIAVPSLPPLAALLPAPLILTGLALITGALYVITQSTKMQPVLSTPWPSYALLLAIVACIPFSITALFLLPVLAFTIFSLRITNHAWLQTNRILLALFCCPLMWPFAQSLHPTIGLFVFSLIILFTQQRIGAAELTARILLLGMASSIDPTLAFLPIIVGLSLVAVWPKRGLIVAAGGFLTTAAFIFFAVSPTIILLKLLFLKSMFADPMLALAAGAVVAIVFIQSIYHWRWWPPVQHAAWCIGAPLLVLALTSLAQTGSVANWSAAILLTAALPVGVYTLLRPTFKHS